MRPRSSTPSIASALVLLACAGPVQLPLYGDRECSRVPDLVLHPPCCMEHDIDYGTCAMPRWLLQAEIPWAEKLRVGRLLVDEKFMRCNMTAGVRQGIAAAAFGAVQGYGAESYCPNH